VLRYKKDDSRGGEKATEYILFMDAMQKQFLHHKKQGKKLFCHGVGSGKKVGY